MSEIEKKRRASFRKRRKLALTILAILLVIVTVFTVGSSFMLYKLNKTLYIDYTEKGKVDYNVSLKENSFFLEDTLPSGQSYIASLIEGVNAAFYYELNTEADNVNYEYSYWLNNQLVIKDTSTGTVIYNPTFIVKDKQTLTQNSNSKLVISESVVLDYESYNEVAESFVSTYGLTGVECFMVSTMHVSVLSLCEEFRESEQNEYVIALNVPLTKKTVNVQMSSTVPNADSKILACENEFNEGLFFWLITGGIIADLVLLLALISTALLTRNKDISYSIKVKRLVAAYRSFIQKIINPFEKSGYQVLSVSSFQEMLEIRDTINSPVLMYENEDMTCTEFIIPTNTNLLYVYELKVADYDELYGIKNEPVFEKEQPAFDYVPVTESAVEEDIVAETVVSEDAVKEDEIYEPATAEPTTIILTPEITFTDDNATDITEDFSENISEESTQTYIAAAEENVNSFDYGQKYNYSFEARLALAGDDAKDYWKRIVTFVRSFGVKVSRSWSKERIYLGRNLFAVIIFKGKKLALAFAKNPATAHAKYHAQDMSAIKRFERTPMLMKISSDRKVKFAEEILTELFEAEGISNKNASVKVAAAKRRSKEKLLAAGLIKPKS